jgi:hypothetical protein
VATIGQSDFTLLGCLRLLPSVDVGGGNFLSSSWGSGPLGVRDVAGQKRFFTTVYFGSVIVEFSHPGTLGANLATAPFVNVAKVWGNIWGPYIPATPNSAGGTRLRGFSWFPGDAHLPEGLLISFGAYYSGDADWPSLALVGISGDVATPIGNWKTADYGFNYHANGSVILPDGRIGITGGGNKGAGISRGPSLFAMTTANMAAATPTTNTTSPPNGTNTPYQQLLLYDSGNIVLDAPPYSGPEPAHRDPDYRAAIFGPLDQDALSASQVYLPVENTYPYDGRYVGSQHKIRNELRLCTGFVGATRLATFATSYSFLPVTGDDWEIDCSNNPANAGFPCWTPQGSIGYFSNLEYVGQPVWIEGASKKGVLCPVDELKGRAHYQPGGLHQESRKRAVYAYAPADLDGSVGIDWVNTIDLVALGIPDPGRGGPVSGEPREMNFAWDADDSIVYVLDNFAWTIDGSEWYPAIWLIGVNLISSAGGTRPEMTEPITRLMPGGYGGKRYGSFTRGGGAVVLLTVTDLANGGGFLATVSGGNSGAANTLFSTRWSGTVGGSAWTVAGIRTGPGDIGGTLPVDYYWWYVLSVFGSATVVSNLVYQPLTDGAAALHDRILEAVTAKIQALAIVGLAGVYLHKFPSVAKSDGPGLVVTYFGEAEEMMGGDRAADEIGFPVLIYQDAPTLVEEETRPRELLWRAQVSEALNGQRLAGVPEVTTCIVEPRSVLEQGSEMLTRNPQDVANRMRSGMLFRFVARAARGA